MSINNINNGLSSNPQLDNQRATQQASNAKTSGAQPQSAEDSVSLTQSAQHLHSMQNKALEAPVNQEKVEQLRNSILNGEYRINPEALANKIAKMESEIFGL